ncbi:MAG: T9SS type A sorting domain-containing protein [Bacteroidetes bacterium]|nr:T9SS type A sorting domain-containing protein [Bacteroidota bacterium]
MLNTKSVMIVVREKTVYIHLSEILKQGNLSIYDAQGNTIFKDKIANSYYEVITLDQPKGKYWVRIDSENLKMHKTFLLK